MVFGGSRVSQRVLPILTKSDDFEFRIPSPAVAVRISRSGFGFPRVHFQILRDGAPGARFPWAEITGSPWALGDIPGPLSPLDHGPLGIQALRDHPDTRKSTFRDEDEFSIILLSFYGRSMSHADHFCLCSGRAGPGNWITRGSPSPVQ